MSRRLRPAVQEHNPFKSFSGPGRRRTDHPLVVGFIVLCLAFIAVTGAMSTLAGFTMNTRLEQFLERGQASLEESLRIREQLVKVLEEQSRAIRRLCLVSAKSKAEAQGCSPDAMQIPPLILPRSSVKEGFK